MEEKKKKGEHTNESHSSEASPPPPLVGGLLTGSSKRSKPELFPLLTFLRELVKITCLIFSVHVYLSFREA